MNNILKMLSLTGPIVKDNQQMACSVKKWSLLGSDILLMIGSSLALGCYFIAKHDFKITLTACSNVSSNESIRTTSGGLIVKLS